MLVPKGRHVVGLVDRNDREAPKGRHEFDASDFLSSLRGLMPRW